MWERNSEGHDSDKAEVTWGRASEDKYEWKQWERGESDRYRGGGMGGVAEKKRETEGRKIKVQDCVGLDYD